MNAAQRRRLNAMCGDLAKQVQWFRKIGREEFGCYLHRDDWRHIFAGVVLGERYVPHPEDRSRLVTLGASSKELTVEGASIVMERIAAFGSEMGVQWSDPEEAAARAAYEREARA